MRRGPLRFPCPKMIACLSVNQRDVDAHAVSAAVNAALEDVAHVYLAPDRLHVGRLSLVGKRPLWAITAAQRLIAGAAPPFDCEATKAGLTGVMGDGFGLRNADDERLRCAPMQRLAAALEQAPVSRALDQSMLEAILASGGAPSTNSRSASASRSSAACRRSSSNPAAIDDTLLSSRYKKSRPSTAPIWATSRAAPSRSSRAAATAARSVGSPGRRPARRARQKSRNLLDEQRDAARALATPR